MPGSVDAGGLFVVDGNQREIFRAHRVQQRLGDGGAWLTDLDHPERGEVWIGTTIEGGANPLVVRLRTYHPDDFNHVVVPLATIFESAVEIGSIVVWT